MVVPQKSWMAYFMENHGKSIYKWMRTGGTPISGNLHMGMDQYLLIPFLGEGTSIYQRF